LPFFSVISGDLEVQADLYQVLAFGTLDKRISPKIENEN